MAEFDLIATSGFGLETLVRHEIQALGYEAKIIAPGKILFRGDEGAIREANLWLRTAERVLVRLAFGKTTDFGQLFDLAREAPWSEWIPVDAEFPVRGKSHKSQLSSVPACQKIVKKAIVEQLRDAHGTQELPETGTLFQLEVALLNDEASLLLDTTGIGLHKRGYRYYVGDAPLRETLSAALVQLSHWKPEQPFWDPFCGSGTLAIEAALIGRNIAPGLYRKFQCEQWPTVAGPAWKELRESAKLKIRPSLPEPLLATDNSEEALKLARGHAAAAGVTDDIHFQMREFQDISSKRQYGCLITNPPYGERLGEREEITALYQSMPQVFRRLKSWSHYIIASRSDFEQLVGQKANKRRKLYNGRLECTFYQYHGPRPGKNPRYTEGDSEQAIAPGSSEPENATPSDTPAIESPVIDASATDVPIVAPTVDHSVADGLVTDTPVVDSPVTDSPVVDPSADNRPVETSPANVDQAGSTQADSDPAGSDPVEPTLPVAPSISELKTPVAPVKPDAPVKPAAPAQAAQAFGGLRAESTRQAEEFANRLRNRARHLRRWPTKREITCYRLYDRDVPDVPLSVDRYEEALVVSEYERPHERTPAEHADWLDLMMVTLSKTLEVPRKLIYLKRRERQQGESQYGRVSEEQAIRIVNEGGLRFQTNLSDYLDTGLFLDHRLTRTRVREEVKGKRFLNLFAYTGSFTVYAADGGAIETTTVDLSRNYLDWAETNLKLNDFTPGLTHRYVRSDSRDFVKALPEEPLFDLVVVDPPTFSNSKRTDEDWDVQRDAVPLLNEISKRMPVGGVIYFSTNYRRFKFEDYGLKSLSVRDISKKSVPEDFRNQRIHRCWRLVKVDC